MTRILALSGSLSDDSNSYKGLLVAVKASQAAGAEVQVIDLRQFSLPIYNPNEDSSDANVASLRKWFYDADGFLLASPEYHNTMGGAFKNAMDYVGGRQIKNKPVGLIAASGGQTAMATLIAMQLMIRSVHGWVVPTLGSIGGADEFTENGRFANEQLQNRFETIGRHLAQAAAAFQMMQLN